MPNFNATDITDKVFQRKGRIGRIWRKRFASVNGGNFLNTIKGWVWDSGESASPKTATKKTRKVKE